MMKTTLAGRFLAMTIMAGLLMASFAFAQKEDHPEGLMPAVHQRQLVEGGTQTYAKASLDTGQCNVPPEFPFHVSFGYAKASLDIGRCHEQLAKADAREAYERLLSDYADRSVRLLTTLQATDPQNVSQLTVLAGMPEKIWCRLHFFCKRGW
jgi:hypothetical protein